MCHLAAPLLEVARDGLAAVGVASGDIDAMLSVIEDRIESGQSGSVWQRRAYDALLASHDRQGALSKLFQLYRLQSRQNRPVAEWEVPL